ncbi:unnamed protein product [Adineta ricciae]|uniref:Uncharacterized protein n=1 Tax=Adineta ricciae TaxID=249248 RepID=A0A813X6H6_ADIRI|nr:unnamed protein product [Adineta ricciae]
MIKVFLSASLNTAVTLLGANGNSIERNVANESRDILIDISNIKLHLLESQWASTFKMTNILTNNITSATTGKKPLNISLLELVQLFIFIL